MIVPSLKLPGAEPAGCVCALRMHGMLVTGPEERQAHAVDQHRARRAERLEKSMLRPEPAAASVAAYSARSARRRRR